MYTRNLLSMSFLVGLTLFGPSTAGTAYADLSQRIDATHILAREYELPQRAQAPGGISFADSETGVRNVRRTAVPKKLGDKETFWANNIATGKFEQISATLRAIGQHCHV